MIKSKLTKIKEEILMNKYMELAKQNADDGIKNNDPNAVITNI